MNVFEKPSETIARRLTAAGRGAIAVVEVVGKRAHEVVLECFQPASPLPSGRLPINEIRYGVWCSKEQASNSEAVSSETVRVEPASKVRSTRSSGESVIVLATTPSRIEVHCHGGNAAVAAILQDLNRQGAGLASSVDVTETNPAEAHSWTDEVACMERLLSQTNTPTTAGIVLQQLRGALPAWSREMVGLLESNDSRHHATVEREIHRMLGFESAARHLVAPWNIVIAGPPNVGKSSLINAILGYQRAITFDMPGTTRDVIHAESAIHGWPVRFSDTAGIRPGDDAIESEGVRFALRTLDTADLVLLVVDASVGITPTHAEIRKLTRCPILLVWNKVDKLSDESNLSTDSMLAVRISATLGHGLEDLAKLIIETIMPNMPTPNDAVPITEFQTSMLKRAATSDNQVHRLQVLKTLASG